ncbi:MAG: serine--tRNA ligase, partial [Phycisphaerae bacterium]|nr:serine--tRNA ligase [Phycisphaerae bacterium]
MIDIKLIRAQPEKFIEAARTKNIQVDIPALLETDRQLLDARKDLQHLRTSQNAAGKKIADLTGKKKQHAISELADLKARAKELGELVDQLEPKFNELMLLVAQPPAPDVPVGQDESHNVPIRTEGKIPTFDFQPKDHVQIGRDLDIIDIPRGVKLAGSRNYALKGPGAMLHYAVLRLAADMMNQKGYTQLNVPVLVNESVMYGTGFFPVGRDDAYLCQRDGMSLIGTAEVPVTAFHTDEILDEALLPKKYFALSTCFRREAGAAGKDTKGLYRIHYFDKVEQVILCRNDEQASIELHHEILANSEEMLN